MLGGPFGLPGCTSLNANRDPNAPPFSFHTAPFLRCFPSNCEME